MFTYIDYLRATTVTSYELDPNTETREQMEGHIWRYIMTGQEPLIFSWEPDLPEIDLFVETDTGMLAGLFVSGIPISSFSAFQDYLRVTCGKQVDPWDCRLQRLRFPCFVNVEKSAIVYCIMLI
jgi:hypothetical protein